MGKMGMFAVAAGLAAAVGAGGTSRADPRKIRRSHRFSRLTQAIGRPDVPGGASDP